jgi:hypothetical protein
MFDLKEVRERMERDHAEILSEIQKCDLDPFGRAHLLLSVADVCHLSATMNSEKLVRAWTSVLATYSRQQLDSCGKYL